MKFDIILCGVGGQGVLSMASIIGFAAMHEGFFVGQTEIHGMAQRGGSVSAHLRISDSAIHSNLIPISSAQMILSMEPLEALRYIDHLNSTGILISSDNQIGNLVDYPILGDYYKHPIISSRNTLIDVRSLAKTIGVQKTANMILIGAASIYLPIKAKSIECSVKRLFSNKGETTIEENLKTFRLSKELLHRERI